MSKEKTTTIKEKNTETPFEYKEGKIGTMLHDVRIKKKLSIEDVSQKLHIKPIYLTAIEESDYDHIPADPYGTGFIRSYASFLGLNTTRIVQIYKEEIKPESPETVEVPQAAPADEENNSSCNLNELYLSNKKNILVGLAILLIAYGAWSIFSSDTTEEATDNTEVIAQNNDFPIQVENYTTEEENSAKEEKPSEQITITEESFEEVVPAVKEETVKKDSVKEKTVETKTEKEPEASAEKKAEPTAPAKKTGRVVLKIKKETWVEVKDEDKLWISKVLHAGDEYVLPENGVGKTVSFGNTDGVDVVIDGKVVTIISNNKKTNIQMDAFLGNH
ncbi:MAG: helix-turn-helix domain-containing protein [Alphaproteobacteria bacterium]|nr:helix-turn-helix domain-containing protein [Alphaproteobacteria bacterium]MBQ8677778.1 helix-turn-helix domain-containing protein [Alphaproteobacteria bacterium]